MFSIFSVNPSCYLPSALNSYLHSSIACPPPPSYLSAVYDTITSPVSSTYTAIRTAMGALVSLPFLSFLLIPTMTSYSTSLNLLFFYITWSTLILSHAPLRVEIVATLAIRLLFYILPSAFFLAFDASLPSAAEGLKAASKSGLPLYNASRSRTLRVLRQVGWSLSNVFLSVLAQALIEVVLTRGLAFRSALKVTTSLPMPFGIFLDLLRGYLVRECILYTLHRCVLHQANTRLGSYHEAWYHSIAAPYPLSASYDHPVAYFIRSFLPTFLPALLFRFHLLTYMLYLTFVSLEETFAYSGYSTVPTNFILGGIARRTDTHVLCGGEGNYGAIGLIDWVMGTSVGADFIDDVVAEADKHDVTGRVERRGKLIGDTIGAKAKKKMNGSNKKGGRTRRDS